MVIPAAIADALPAAIDLVARREKVLLEACREPGFDARALARAVNDSADIH